MIARLIALSLLLRQKVFAVHFLSGSDEIVDWESNFQFGLLIRLEDYEFCHLVIGIELYSDEALARLIICGM